MEILGRETLIQRDQELLKKLLAKNPADLNAEEAAILRSRVSYLSPLERMALKAVLEVGNPPKGTGKPPVEIAEEVVEAKPKKKAKKRK